jgi:long-chain acyl-CoA synthetase
LTRANGHATIRANRPGGDVEASTTTRTATLAHRLREALAQPRPRAATQAYRDGEWRDESWDTLARHAEVVARGLAELGLDAGERIAILASSREEWTWTDLGALFAGLVVVPIYQTSSPAECLHVLRDSGARAVLCENAEQLAKVEEVRGSLPELEHLMVIDPDGRTTTLADLEARGEQQAAERPGAYEERRSAISPDDVATIIYTSGTTGPPKGCVLLHRNFDAILAMVPEDALLGDDLIYLYLPLAHSFARLVEFVAIDRGATTAFSRGPDFIADDLLAVRPTVLPSVPRVFEKVHRAVQARVAESPAPRRALFEWALRVGHRVADARAAGREPGPVLRLQHAVADRLALSKVRERLGGRIRVCVVGGAPISPEILEFFAACGLTVLEAYGLTETATGVSANRIGDVRPGTVGLPLRDMDVRIADDGEVLLRGPNIFAGYWHAPEATAAALVDGWLYTGDVGELVDGYLKITDRKKDIIITAGGKNVSPANLENALRASPYIADACVIGDRRPFVAALVTLEDAEVDRVAEQHGWSERGAALGRRPEILALVQQAVDHVNAEVARASQIRQFAILAQPFTMDSGELTPTLKVKRQVVLERYAGVIEELYARPQPAPA